MSDKHYFPWLRYWFPEGNKNYSSFVQNGYLTLPSPKYSRHYPAIPCQLSDLTQIPVLILLGDPGCGKSHALADEHERLKSENPDDQVIYCNLKEFGEGRQQSLKDKLLYKQKLEPVGDEGRVWVLLDGLDECGIHEPACWLKDEFIGQINNPERVFVRITCRASHWPEFLEKAFSERWRPVAQRPVEQWRLCPLREEDVRIAAQKSEINSEAFLSAISERHVEQLAALPVTLLFMLRLFNENRLPAKRSDIYEQGLKLLCEDSPEQQKSRSRSTTTAKVRFLTAARISLGYILHGCNGIWHGPSVDCPTGLFDSNKISDTTDNQDINEQAITEALELTGIFSRLDWQRFEFPSRTFAEFLTAWFLWQSSVSNSQKLKLLLHPESQRLIPDLFETASWLGALDSSFLNWLVKQEPEAALEADFAILAQADLPGLVDGLLALAVKEQRLSYDWQRLSKLNYLGLETKLSSIITGSSNSLASRYLAIKIAVSCKLQSLGNELADIALNYQEDFELRKLAISCLQTMDNDAKLRLISIAQSNQDLAIKAVALSVLGPKLMGPEAFFSQITPDFLEAADYDLRYVIDEDTFVNQMDANGIKIGLEWIAEHAPLLACHFTSNRLKSRLLTMAFNYLSESGMVTALVNVMRVLRNHSDHFFDGLEPKESKKPFDNTEKRRIVLDELIKQIDSKEVWTYFQLDCFREEDGLWLFQQWDTAFAETERRVIAEVIYQHIFQYNNREVIEEVLNRAGYEVVTRDPLLTECLAWLVEPMDLASQATINCRKRYFEQQKYVTKAKQHQQVESLPNPPVFYILSHLTACESGDLSRWPYLVASLGLEDDKNQAYPHQPDSLPGWRKADDTLRSRIEAVAIKYLEQSKPPDDDVLLQNSRTTAQASGGLAVSILVVTNSLINVSKERLSRWCLAIVTHFFNQPGIQEQVFREVRSIVPGAFDVAVLKAADYQAATGSLLLLRSCREFWHPAFLQFLIATKLKEQNWPFSCRIDLAVILMDHDAEKIVMQLLEWLTFETESSHQCAAAAILFRYALSKEKVWSVIQQILETDEIFARDIISTFAHPSGHSAVIDSKLDATKLGWLYERIIILFPPSEDEPIPNGIYSASPRHDLANFRDSLIGRLVSLATPDAIKELDRICSVYPDTSWLVRVRADAHKALWQRERTQISFAETIKLLSNSDLTVVRNSRELMCAVEEALLCFAHEAQHGSPPLSVFLWNEKQKSHFSEQRLSDFLKFYLEREWRGRRIIINREVEIRNLHDFGIGERSDLFIQAISSSNGDTNQPHPCVVIEIKPDEKAKPAKDIPEQLVAKYLDGVSRNCGIYLVGWFGKSCRSIEELRNDANQHALNSSNDNVSVHCLVLNLSHPLDTV